MKKLEGKKEGAKVVLVDLNEEAGNNTIKELQQYQSVSVFVQANLAGHDNLTDIVKKLVERFGKLEILVNNAHASKNMPFHETTQADFDLLVITGFYPMFYFMQTALPHLKKTTGIMVAGGSIKLR